jgi:hypothetical protein
MKQASDGHHRSEDRDPPPRRPIWPDGAATSAAARQAALTFLDDAVSAGWDRPTDRACETVRLLVSEPVTDARKHPSGPCGLHLELDRSAAGRLARITVWDTSPHPPAPHPFNPKRIGGQGLRIVQAVSRCLTVDAHPAGNRVRAEIELL